MSSTSQQSPCRLLLVCHSLRPKVAGGGNCYEKGASALLASLSQQIEAGGLDELLEVRTGPCQRNCPDGISAKLIPGLHQYSRLQATPIEELLETILP